MGRYKIEQSYNTSSRWLTELFDAYGLVLRLHTLTHTCGGLLDVAPVVTIYDTGFSDHEWSVPVCRPPLPVVSFIRRLWRVLCKLCQPDSWTGCSIYELAALYKSEVTSILDYIEKTAYSISNVV